MEATATPQNCDLRGIDAVLYFNTGDSESPVWVEHIGLTGDVTAPETEDENELNTRNRNRQTKQFTAGDIDHSITGTQVMDPLYIGWQYLYAARAKGEARDFMWLSQPLSELGAVGWRGKYRNFDRTHNAPETGSQTQNFNLKPAACTDMDVRPVRVEEADTASDWDPAEIDDLETTTTTTAG